MHQRARIVLIYMIIASLLCFSKIVVAQDEFYSIQVSAFKQEKNANDDVALFKDKGLDSFSRYEDTGGKGMWHRVYVGRYGTKKEAAEKAKILKDEGFIADFTVRLVKGEPAAPPEEDATTAVEDVQLFTERDPNEKVPTKEKVIPPARMPGGWEIVVDLSGSTRETFQCSGYTKLEAIFTILKRLNTKIPDLDYQAALRQFAYKRAWTRKDYTKLVYEPQRYDRKAFHTAISELTPSDAITPLGWAIAAAEEDLMAMPGKKALIIISDFKKNHDFGGPMSRARSAAIKMGDDLTIYTINVGFTNAENQLAREVAEVTKGGITYNGCKLMTDEEYFDNMTAQIFGVPNIVVIPVCQDSDNDLVCDEDDQCPNTPANAPVDERGCWIAAFDQFFDYDKYDVKEEFLPRLKASAKIIQDNPHLDVVIAGHTDSKGSEEYNMKLGQKRAEAVMEWLVKFGADQDHLKAVSYGESQPIADNETDEGRAKNRRVELHVSEIKTEEPEKIADDSEMQSDNQPDDSELKSDL